MVYKDGSDYLLEHRKQGLEFFHVATGKTAMFKAYLTDYSDNFSSEWASEKVYGRMDPIHTFQGTERTITLAWDVPSADEVEGRTNFGNASTMYSMLYPAYRGEAGTDAGIIAAPPMVKLKFGNLIFDADADFMGDAKSAGLLGWLSDLSFAPDLAAGFFDETPGELIPQTIKLSCSFHVLHTHKLGWDAAQAGKLRKKSGNFPYDDGVGDATDPAAGKTGKTDAPLSAPAVETRAFMAERRRKRALELNKHKKAKAKTDKALGN
jgi:hypothetical protein